MKKRGKVAKRYTKSLGMEKYVNYKQCEIWSLNKDFQIAVLLQCRHLLIPTWSTRGNCPEESREIVVCFELLGWSFLQKIALLVTDLVRKIQSDKNNLLLIYYLKGTLNIYILLIEWSRFWTSFCTLMLGVFVNMSSASIISRLLSFLLLSERYPLQMMSVTTFAEVPLPKLVIP